MSNDIGIVIFLKESENKIASIYNEIPTYMGSVTESVCKDFKEKDYILFHAGGGDNGNDFVDRISNVVSQDCDNDDEIKYKIIPISNGCTGDNFCKLAKEIYKLILLREEIVINIFNELKQEGILENIVDIWWKNSLNDDGVVELIKQIQNIAKKTIERYAVNNIDDSHENMKILSGVNYESYRSVLDKYLKNITGEKINENIQNDVEFSYPRDSKHNTQR